MARGTKKAEPPGTGPAIPYSIPQTDSEVPADDDAATSRVRLKRTGKKARAGQGNRNRSASSPDTQPDTASHATLRTQTLIDGEAEAITRQCIKAALDGDRASLKLIMERLVPPRRSRALNISLPTIRTVEDIPKAQGAILAAVAGGKLTPEEAEILGRVISQYRQAWEIAEILSRLDEVELRVRARK